MKNGNLQHFVNIMSQRGYPGGTSGREPTCQCRRCKSLQFYPWVGKIQDPLEKEMATHCNIPTWRILQTEEPGGLQYMG